MVRWFRCFRGCKGSGYIRIYGDNMAGDAGIWGYRDMMGGTLD